MTKLFSYALAIFLVIGVFDAHSQDIPQQPIVLEHADSVVGTGGLESGIREFFGNVRFVQGNVRVSCDKAIQYIGSNRADLFGKVRVEQGSLVMRAPAMVYDGNALMATASGGVTVSDSGRVVTSSKASYSTDQHVATFLQNVRVYDDSMRIASDTLVYERDTKKSTALGNVFVSDTIGSAVITGAFGIHDKVANTILMIGNAQSWSFGSDTSYLSADTIRGYRATASYEAHGKARFIRGVLSSLAEDMYFNEFTGKIALRNAPVVWNDSTQLTGDTIDIDAPMRHVKTIRSTNDALLISRTDTVRTDRFDQVAGRVITMFVDEDTLRRLLSVDDARSITWRVEEDKPQGLATFAADTIKVLFEAGQPVDIFWLGGIEGEHHPENIVAGRSKDSYRLEGFDWKTNRPLLVLPPPKPEFRKP